MKFSLFFVALIGAVSAYPSRRDEYIWQAAGADDRRSPCPFVNALANHGILPRNGLNISMADLIVAFNTSINLAPAATQLVGAKALSAGDGTTFNLDDLNKHGILEHDASLSRWDTYFGNNHNFNATIWAGTKTFFNSSTISIAQAAAARKARVMSMSIENPVFNQTADETQFSFIEQALYLGIFGNLVDGNPPKEYITVLFEEERLPYAEGWSRSTEQITATQVLTLTAKVVAAT